MNILKEILEEINKAKIESIRNVRTGDYRIGLTKAEQIINSKIKGQSLPIDSVIKRFSIDEKVIWDGMYYWVLEINEEARKVLLANDRNQDHPQYNDWWVNIEEVNAC